MAKKIAIFASGTGTNAEAIMKSCLEDNIAKVVLVICSNPDAKVLNVADRFDIPWVLVDKDFMADEEAMLALLEEYGVQFLVLAGWLKLIPSYLTQAFKGRILNIHPALLPKFGGKGMWGHHVHQAVKEAGEKVSGITVHEVNEAYDEGRIVAQFSVDILPSDDATEIERKVRALEIKHFAPVIKKYIQQSKM
jgi:phosphoribosylglycinamide formyltransferase-1